MPTTTSQEQLTADEQLAMLAQGLHDEGVAKIESDAAVLPSTKADKMRALRDNFSPQKLIQLFIDHPNWSFREYAEATGHTVAWFCSYLASDDFQQKLDPFRSQIANPQITGTLDERFKALTLQALDTLQTKLSSAEVPDVTVVTAVGLGIKALGLGAKRQQEEEKAKPRTLQDMAAYLENVGQQKADGADIKLGVLPTRAQLAEDVQVVEVPRDY